VFGRPKQFGAAQTLDAKYATHPFRRVDTGIVAAMMTMIA